MLKSGRILIPTWFTTGGDGHKPSGFGNIYSDDGFRSVRIGAILQQDAEHSTIVNPNEGAIVELADGQVLATVRHDCEQRMRAVSYSSGGTGPWSCPEYRPDLPDPICHASLQRLGPAEELGFDGILFSNCANADEGIAEKKARGLCKYNWSDDARKNLTVRFSRDGGRHFSAGILIDENAPAGTASFFSSKCQKTQTASCDTCQKYADLRNSIANMGGGYNSFRAPAGCGSRLTIQEEAI